MWMPKTNKINLHETKTNYSSEKNKSASTDHSSIQLLSASSASLCMSAWSSQNQKPSVEIVRRMRQPLHSHREQLSSWSIQSKSSCWWQHWMASRWFGSSPEISVLQPFAPAVRNNSTFRQRKIANELTLDCFWFDLLRVFNQWWCRCCPLIFLSFFRSCSFHWFIIGRYFKYQFHLTITPIIVWIIPRGERSFDDLSAPCTTHQ